MLSEPLERMCARIEGAILAAVFRADGEVLGLARANRAPHHAEDERALWADYGRVLEQARESAQMLAAGDLEELMLSSERGVTVIRPLARDVYLSFVVRADAIGGKARYLCRVTAPRLTEALIQAA